MIRAGKFRVETKPGHLYIGAQEYRVIVRHDIGEIWVSDLLTPEHRARLVNQEMRRMGYVPLVVERQRQ